MRTEFYLKLTEIINKSRILMDEPMSKHTTFKIGGPADYYVKPEHTDELAGILKLCSSLDMPFYILGNGSNLLVGDKGFRGAIIDIGSNFSDISFQEQEDSDFVTVTAGAGVMLSKLAALTAEHSLEGFEFAAGIPGTLGGAVTMNAGAYGGEIKDFILHAEVLDKMGQRSLLNKEELMLGYRMSAVQTNSYIVIRAAFSFRKGDKDEVKSRIKELNDQRREKQPLEYPSAGSTFKRPEGYFAGKLIMDSGLRGYRVGDAMISEKHCGFVINAGNAAAKDVRTLISDVDRIVFDKFGVHLEPEVKMIGEF